MDDTYKTITGKSEGIYKEKGSKFLAYAFPVTNEDETKEIISQIKKEHHGARHHCYAWRIGTDPVASRANDDGEPSSTAGKPILGQLQRFDVTNTLVVVVRYFGGTLLGTSGLIRAYKSAAEEALAHAEVVTRLIEDTFLLTFGYPSMNEVMLLVKQENLNLLSTRFELDCRLLFSVRRSASQRIEALFQQLYGVTIERVELSDVNN